MSGRAQSELDGAASELGPNAIGAQAASITPLERTGKEEEVANVGSLLPSDGSSIATGSELFADGSFAQI